MLHLYGQKTVSRDELVREARASMLALVKEMRQGICDHPKAEQRMWELAQALDGVKGQKKYGYLPKRVKKLVDEVVDEMERLPAVAKCYEQWQMLQGEVEGYYSDAPPKEQKLSERKEFRQIKNSVVAEAERLGFETCILPWVCAEECRRSAKIEILGVRTVQDVIDRLF